MYTQEFAVSPHVDEEGAGLLLVTDAKLLVRPAVPGQLHQVRHDTAHFAAVMDLGDVADGWGIITWHVVTDLPAAQANCLLDRGWYAYFDGYCMGKVWIRAIVNYIGAGNATLGSHEYGFTDGQIHGDVNVYCREYWEGLAADQADPAGADWAPLLREHIIGSGRITEPIALARLEEALGRGLPLGFELNVQQLVVVRPSQEAPYFTARGFHLVAPSHQVR